MCCVVVFQGVYIDYQKSCLILSAHTVQEEDRYKDRQKKEEELREGDAANLVGENWPRE